MPDRSAFRTKTEYNAYFREYWKTRRRKQRKYMREYRKRLKETTAAKA